jgi:hypothetical protein
MVASTSSSKYSWILDSGASFHMTPCSSILTECTKERTCPFVKTANGTPLAIEYVGNIDHKHDSKVLKIPKVRFIPELNLNLLSVSQIADHGCDIIFSQNKFLIQDHLSKRTIGECSRKDDFYYVTTWTLPTLLAT